MVSVKGTGLKITV